MSLLQPDREDDPRDHEQREDREEGTEEAADLEPSAPDRIEEVSEAVRLPGDEVLTVGGSKRQDLAVDEPVPARPQGGDRRS